MLLDFTKTETTAFDADLCIVGSGAAGLTLAAHLAGRCRVLVVEAGGTRWDTEGLAGEAADWAFTGFVDGRARGYGGATRRWAGQLIRLDPIDFARRDWVPHSGWPITAAALDPFYDRAEAFLGVSGAAYDARLWGKAGLTPPALDGTGVYARFTAYMRRPDFTRHLGGGLFRGERAGLLLNAAGVRLEHDGAGVRTLSIRGPGGRSGTVTARAFALCGGGIANPRLLLASGLGGGLTGRFFQDHPSGTTGIVHHPDTRAVQDHFRRRRIGGVRYWPKLALTEAEQRRARSLNANCIMLYDYADASALSRAKALIGAATGRHPGRAAAAALRVLPHVPELVGRGVHAVATGQQPAFRPSRVMIKAHVEQRPDPDNRITLGNECDQFGMPLPRLHWRVHKEELRSLRLVTDAAGRAFSRLGWGEIVPEPWLDGEPDAARPHLEDTYHHHGTTRMSAAPSEGVVDADCRVWDVPNLFVAGSSVFPTSGYANPTLTIVALAIRLADTLERRL
jgi:choline dehydrogenase-like flavoprotein